MRAAGVNLVTVGVFSWAMLEPRPDELRWDWLDEVLDLLHAGGIAVDLATPSASPPPWLATAGPDDVRGGRRGRADERRARATSSARGRRCTATGWRGSSGRSSTGTPGTPRSRCGTWATSSGRRASATCAPTGSAPGSQARYGDLDALNRAWGTAFWSQRYGDWQEIVPPRTAPYVHNPTQLLDFRRFTSDQLRDVYRLQAEIIRASSTAPVTTNAMGFFPLVDQFSWADDLDVVADDHYADPADPSSPARAALTHDLTRGVGGGRPWALLEQAAGAVSWRPHNLPKPAGGMLRDSLRAVAHGADAVCYFQWRASAQGSERFHSAMLPHAGPDTDLHRAVREQGRSAGPAAVRSSAPRVDARVALVFDWPSLWAGEADSVPSTHLRVPDQLAAYHEPFWRAGIATDVVPPGADLDRYDLVVVPLLHLVSDADAANLARVVDARRHAAGRAVQRDRRRGPAHPAGPLPGAVGRRARGVRRGAPAAAGGRGSGALRALRRLHRLPLVGAPDGGRCRGSRHLRGCGPRRPPGGPPARQRLVRLDRAAGTGARRDRGGLRRSGGCGGAGARACPDGVEVALRGGLLFVLNHGEARRGAGLDGPRPADGRPTSTGCCGWPPAVPRC